MSRHAATRHEIVLDEGGQLWFVVNGQRTRAEDVTFVPPDRLRWMCDEARLALEAGEGPVVLAGSIGGARTRPRHRRPSGGWKKPPARPHEVVVGKVQDIDGR